MNLAKPFQKFQDWITQQWVISTGQKFDPEVESWLNGPHGQIGTIGDEFIKQIAQKENLFIKRNCQNQGLIESFEIFNFSKSEIDRLSAEIVNFYQKTSDYRLNFSAKWNPFFRMGGRLINLLFSRRLNQLNIPTERSQNADDITSEIIALKQSENSIPKYIIWFRTIKSTGKVLYSGVYSTCQIPSGEVCVKAVFPLPNGNATVIMTPEVGSKGEFILDSSGKKFGNAGFYFLLNDSKGNHWAKFVKSFRDKLTVEFKNGKLSAQQKLSLWKKKVVVFDYGITLKEDISTKQKSL